MNRNINIISSLKKLSDRFRALKFIGNLFHAALQLSFSIERCIGASADYAHNPNSVYGIAVMRKQRGHGCDSGAVTNRLILSEHCPKNFAVLSIAAGRLFTFVSEGCNYASKTESRENSRKFFWGKFPAERVDAIKSKSDHYKGQRPTKRVFKFHVVSTR